MDNSPQSMLKRWPNQPNEGDVTKRVQHSENEQWANLDHGLLNRTVWVGSKSCLYEAVGLFMNSVKLRPK